ncbi:hypothetical protein [Candidatus Legionella polyplacis]|uniref:Uncharacterized protein n=1 Tax=Candidatus Legionella polyplacis TaxID=2005262 RepID=A0ABZ2GXY7_9GAMM
MKKKITVINLMLIVILLGIIVSVIFNIIDNYFNLNYLRENIIDLVKKYLNFN